MNLEWSRIDFQAQEIALRARDTKTGKARAIPFESGTPLAELLTRQRESIKALERRESRVIVQVFPEVAPVTFKRWWLRAVKAAGLPALRPHDLRRSFVREAIRRGVSEGVTVALVGHRTRAMLARYDITSAQDLREGMRRLATPTDTQTDTRKKAGEGEPT